MKRTGIALSLVLAITMREVPGAAAPPDLSEARRRFEAAVHSSDEASAAAEAALEFAIGKAAALQGGDAARAREALSNMLDAVRTFKAQKLKALGRGEKDLLAAISEYAKAARTVAASFNLGLPVVATAVAATSVASAVASIAVSVAVFAIGSDLLAAQAAMSKLDSELGSLDTSIAALIDQVQGLRAEEARGLEKERRSNAAENVGSNVQKAAAALEDLRAALSSVHEATGASQSARDRLRVAPVAVGRGCTHSVEARSLFTSTGGTLVGILACGPFTIASSVLRLEGGSISGGGTFAAWSKNFAMIYSASGDVLTARGSLSGIDTPWTRVPGFEAEYRIEGPKLDLKLEGPSLAPTFGAGTLKVRTVAKKPDGNPWSTASATPGAVVVPAPPSDGIPVPFPALPAAADAEKAARDACRSAANRIPQADARNAALAVCNADHPSPPGLPNLPPSISLKVGDVFR